MSDEGLARYVYCVTGAGAAAALQGVAGVDGRFAVEALDHAELSAAVSAVSPGEFGADALKRNLEDLGWLERTARAHQAVLDRALAADAVVPLRLCTMFADEAAVREMLDREREVFLEALERVRGRAEWSVKVLADPDAVQEAARERSPELAALSADARAESPGRAYLARKKLGRLLQEQARAMAEAAAAEIDSHLREEAVGAVLLPPQHPDLAARSGDMLLNGAYLVERAREPRFAALATELGVRHREAGLELEVSGPWAPYNFVAAGGER